MASYGLANWPRALVVTMAALVLLMLSVTTTSASSGDSSITRGARRALAQAGNSQLVAGRSDSKEKDKEDDKGRNKNKCPPGHFLPKRGACTPCPIGSFSESDDQEACEVCPTGSTTGRTGSSKKSDCSGEC
jgi:hypothetical protein